MNDNIFKNVALPLVLKYEGGYINNPFDKGGETNHGITKLVYDQYRIKNKLLPQSVKMITPEEIETIYLNNYWLLGKCDKILSSKIAVFHFDTCVNMGTTGAIKLLQASCAITADGIFGLNTIAAVNTIKDSLLLFRYYTIRRTKYTNIVNNSPKQKIFLDGWMNRVNSIYKKVNELND